jgi:hypothetical protein
MVGELEDGDIRLEVGESDMRKCCVIGYIIIALTMNAL